MSLTTKTENIKEAVDQNSIPKEETSTSNTPSMAKTKNIKEAVDQNSIPKEETSTSSISSTVKTKNIKETINQDANPKKETKIKKKVLINKKDILSDKPTTTNMEEKKDISQSGHSEVVYTEESPANKQRERRKFESENKKESKILNLAAIERKAKSEPKQNSERKIMDINKLKSLSFDDLFKTAEDMDITIGGSVLKQDDLIFSIAKKASENNYIIHGGGVFELLSDGFGFIRSANSNYSSSSDDVYISPGQVRKLGLRAGDEVYGEFRVPIKKEERYLSLLRAFSINKSDIGVRKRRVHFDNLTPIYPDSHLRLECDNVIMHNNKPDLSPRIIDIISPLGKGQRALIVAPPKTGKTVLLQSIANSISTNHKEVKLIVLLIGERPEEVTDMVRSVKGEVVSSTFDEPANRHVQLAELAIERAKRMVENGHDVVILLDSITRLARAYNAVVPSSGKVLTGGVDSNALQRPKRLFGAARNIEGGGSLTIIATALVETESKGDGVIFEEFKGTGNNETILDRKLAEKRLYPTIDIKRSGTRREELLLDKDVLSKIWILRRILSPMGVVESMEFLQEKFIRTKNNADFFDSMKSSSA